MGLLEDYEQQYSVLTAEITSNIGRLGIVSIGKFNFSDVQIYVIYHIFINSSLFLDDRRDLIVEINRGLDESQELVCTTYYFMKPINL